MISVPYNMEGAATAFTTRVLPPCCLRRECIRDILPLNCFRRTFKTNVDLRVPPAYGAPSNFAVCVGFRTGCRVVRAKAVAREGRADTAKDLLRETSKRKPSSNTRTKKSVAWATARTAASELPAATMVNIDIQPQERPAACGNGDCLLQQNAELERGKSRASSKAPSRNKQCREGALNPDGACQSVCSQRKAEDDEVEAELRRGFGNQMVWYPLKRLN